MFQNKARSILLIGNSQQTINITLPTTTTRTRRERRVGNRFSRLQNAHNAITRQHQTQHCLVPNFSVILKPFMNFDGCIHFLDIHESSLSNWPLNRTKSAARVNDPCFSYRCHHNCLNSPSGMYSSNCDNHITSITLTETSTTKPSLLSEQLLLRNSETKRNTEKSAHLLL